MIGRSVLTIASLACLSDAVQEKVNKFHHVMKIRSASADPCTFWRQNCKHA